MPGWNWQFEEAVPGGGVAGVDEAGRGPWAGPVVAAAVMFLDRAACPGALDDSKKLSRARRLELFELLRSNPSVIWGVGEATVGEIDTLNILQATFLAMRRAWESLRPQPAFLLIDGNRLPPGAPPARAVVGGDGLSPSIAAASVLAKETRDRIMETAERTHPGYGFARHKGYGTREHQEALGRLGPSVLHRRSFAPVAALAGKG